MIIEASDVWKVYSRGKNPVEALQGIDLTIAQGTFGIIMGPSGGGKSTLLHLLGAMDRPTRGSLKVCGVDLQKAGENDLNRFRRENIGFIFQFYNLIPSITAVENVALPLLAQGMRRRAALSRAEDLLGQMGLGDRMRSKPVDLSGGEQQRVAIGRAVANHARLVLADEPTGDLDEASAQTAMDLMRSLNRQTGVTFITATHNERFCAFATHLYRLHSGKLTPCSLPDP